jgi:hypothetical protein
LGLSEMPYAGSPAPLTDQGVNGTVRIAIFDGDQHG